MNVADIADRASAAAAADATTVADRGGVAVGVSAATAADRAGAALVVNAVSVADRASAAVGIALPLQPGITQRSAGLEALWLSPRSWLVCSSVDDETRLVARVRDAFPDMLVHAAPFTDALCWLELSGLQSHDLLTEGAFLSLEPGGLPTGHAKRALVAGITAILIRRRESAWLLAVERSRARYFADWLTAAAQGGEPWPPTPDSQSDGRS